MFPRANRSNNVTGLILVSYVVSLLCDRYSVWSCYVFPPESKDPCSEKVCDFGAQCVSSIDGLTARCQCPVKCDNFGDSVGSDEVCGSDAETYTNECEMKKTGVQRIDRDRKRKYDGNAGKLI